MANVLQVIGLNTVTPQLEAGQTSNLDTYSMVSPLTINPSGTAGYSGTNALTVTGNVSANALYQGTTNQAATTSIQLTASSVTSWIITGSGGQTIILPDATTLPVGAMFTFNNNQSSGAITVNVFGSGSTPATVQSGGYATLTLLTKSVAAGTWDVHYGTPSNVTWSTNTLNFPGSITGSTWNGNAIGVLYGGTGTTTSTGSGSVVLSTSPTLVTPVLGAATGTSLALNGATLGTNNLAVTGTTYLNGQVGIGTSTLTTGYAVIGGTQSAAPAMLSVTGTNTNAGTTIYGISSNAVLTGTTAATAYYGAYNAFAMSPPSGTTIANAWATYSSINLQGTSTPTSVYPYSGTWQLAANALSGTIVRASAYYAPTHAISPTATTNVTSAIQFHAETVTQGVLNTITNAYSFYGSQAPTGATNTWGLYIVGAAANYLANSLTVGGGGTNNVLINGSTTVTITAANAVSNAGGTQVTFTFTAAIGTAYPVGSSITTSGFTLAGFTNGTYAVVTSSRLAVTVTATATASSTASVGGTLTQASPAIIAQGSDTNISLNLVTKGTGAINLQTGATTATQFQVADTVSAVNYVQVTGNPTGAYPTISAQGADAITGLIYATKGASSHIFRTLSIIGPTQFSINHTVSAVNSLIATGSAAASAPSITATGSDLNVSLNLVTKGAGTVQINGTAWQKTNALLFTTLSYYIAPTSTATTIAVTGASGSGVVATLTFSAISKKIPVGTVITITGMTPSGYNASNAQVTASSTTSVSYANTTTTAFSSGGTIASGTSYTPSSGAVVLSTLVVGSGGGGGFGGTYAAISGGSGGGAGGGAGWAFASILVSGISAPVTITIGTGGATGQSGVTPTGGSIAGQGGQGANSSFAGYLLGGGGGGGAPGVSATASGGGGPGWGGGANGGFGTNTAAGTGTYGGSGGFNANGAGGSASNSLTGALNGGSGGGGSGTSGQSASGGNCLGGPSGGGSGGGFVLTAGTAVTGASSGTTLSLPSGSNASAGANGSASDLAIYTSSPQAAACGGGGGTSSATSGNGQAGGAGVFGSGGGGGGAGNSTNSLVGGNGGKGGDGYVYIVEFF